MTLRLRHRMVRRMNKRNQEFFNLSKLKIVKDKRGIDLLAENIVYILLVVLVLAPMFLGVTLVGRQVTLYEQVYAKQIALIINKAEPGMEIEYTNFRMFKLAADNEAPSEIVSIDNLAKVVTVRLSSGNGYHYEFFNEVDVAWKIIHNEKTITLKILESTGGSQNGG